MKLSILEPLGVEKDKLLKMCERAGGGNLEIAYYDTRILDSAVLVERSRDADIVILSNLPFKREVIEQCDSLKLILVAFTGVDHVAMDACRERGITVCNCAGYSTAAVADLVFGLLIALYRNILSCDRVVRTCGTKDGLVGYELEGKKFGVVGTGAIGIRVAKIAQAFGCEVLAYSRTKKPESGLTYVSMEELLANSDIVSLHVPLTDATRGLIGYDQLKLMKPNAVLINTARGPVVDSQALAQALKEGVIAGAGVDVFEIEPPIDPEHPLFYAPNLIATPHVAFATKEALYKRAVIVCDNLEKWLAGKPQNVIK